ncbi:MAG: RNA polymerase sigma factor [Verrucomicrobiota bacterium]
MINVKPETAVPSGGKPTLHAVFEAEECALVRFACGLVKRRAVAEEIVQEGFFRLHRHWDEVENPRAWVYRAVRNLALSHLRKFSRETDSGEEGVEPLLPPDSSPLPDEALGRLEAVGTVKLLLAELKEDDRKLIELKYVHNLSYAKIGETLGLSVGNVGYRLHHLLKDLAQSMQSAGIAGSEG